VRVWSTDWWVDKNGSLERLDAALKALLELSRSLAAAQAEDKSVAVAQTKIELVEPALL
jgi:CRISPR/Cas system-associated protein Cas7 (RAMP superfamily)